MTVYEKGTFVKLKLKWYLFCQNDIQKGKGMDLMAVLPHIDLYRVPPPPTSTRLLGRIPLSDRALKQWYGHWSDQTKMKDMTHIRILKTMSVIHSTKLSGNFGLKLNGSVWSKWESFEKIGPPFQVDPFSLLDRSDQNAWQFHLIFTTHSQSQYLAVQYLPCTTWWKTLIIETFIDCYQRISVTHTSMWSYNRSVATLQVKCMFWLLKTVYFPREFRVFFPSFERCLSSHGKDLLKITHYPS